MANRLLFTQVNRAFNADGTPSDAAQAYFYENGTTTQLTVYADEALTTAYAQPLVADGYGVFAPVYSAGDDPFRILIKDKNGVTLDGYPQDDIIPATDVTAAASITFSPTETVTATNVQDAIEEAAAASASLDSAAQRSLTPWTTGGTADAYTITPVPPATGYGSWQAFLVRPNRANSGASTLNVNALGARSWQKLNASGTPTALSANDILPYIDHLVVYDGTRFLSIMGGQPLKGGDANGIWTRWADGTQTCTHRVTGLGPVSTAAGNVFASAAITGLSWAMPFSAVPYMPAPTAFSVAQNRNVWVSRRTQGSAANIGQVVIHSPVTLADTDFTVEFTAFGRWY